MNTVTEKQYATGKKEGQAKLLCNSNYFSGFEIEWDQNAKVTTSGTMVYFAQFLNSGGLFDKFCKDSPLTYKSNNAPNVYEVFGTLIVSIINGYKRYAHINRLRKDQIGIELLNMSKVCSEDSIRRALKRGSEEDWDSWLSKQERIAWEPLLTEPYIVDIDNTVKPIYGHQEGAEVGYNPHKPGRPSHNYHTYLIGDLRIVLGVDVLPGKSHSGKHSMPGLWKIIDSLPPNLRPRIIRGDVSYGNESIMSDAEIRTQPYLFKLCRHNGVKSKFKQLCMDEENWNLDGAGWEYCSRRIKFSSWSCERRCVFIRRLIESPPAKQSSKKHNEFEFVKDIEPIKQWDYVCLVTNDETLPVDSISQLYRNRADCENVFDEIKNQWGWSGFVTRDLKRCRIIARIISIVYNWWNVFVRLAQPKTHFEAITSRPLLLNTIGRLVQTGRRKIIRLTSNHSLADKVQASLENIRMFINRLIQTAEQLKKEQIWAIILSVAFVKWLKGKILSSVGDDQELILLIKNQTN